MLIYYGLPNLFRYRAEFLPPLPVEIINISNKTAAPKINFKKTPDTSKNKTNYANQENINESTESKLLLDQPDTITTTGKVEHVVESQEDTQLNDSTDNKDEHEGNCSCETCSDQMLLNEDPMDGVDIIID